MGVDPSQYHQVFGRAVVEEGALVYRLASITRTFLLGDYNLGDEDGVGNQGSAEHTASFKVVACVWRRDFKELLTKGGREEHGPQGLAVF